MSNFYLCDHCKQYDGPSVVAGTHGYCKAGCNGYGSNLRRKKVMVDHGHANGRRPYDDPLDVCPDFERRGDA